MCVYCPPLYTSMIPVRLLEWSHPRLLSGNSQQWVTVHMRTSPDEYREPFKGTVRIPSVASGRGYCLQTARIWSRGAKAISLENRPTLQITGARKDYNLVHFNHTVRWRSPRLMVVRSHRCIRGGSSRKLKNKPRLVEPFYSRRIYISSLMVSYHSLPSLSGMDLLKEFHIGCGRIR